MRCVTIHLSAHLVRNRRSQSAFVASKAKLSIVVSSTGIVIQSAASCIHVKLTVASELATRATVASVLTVSISPASAANRSLHRQHVIVSCEKAAATLVSRHLRVARTNASNVVTRATARAVWKRSRRSVDVELSRKILPARKS